MVEENNLAWLAERGENWRTLQADKRRREWMALMLRIELQWYESWRGSLADDRVPLSPWKPWLYNWR